MNIITINDPNSNILKTKCVEIQINEIEQLKNIINDMLNIVYNMSAKGLAAPQIGISKRIFVMYDGTVCINPQYIFRSGKITSHGERCLSLFDSYNIKRNKEVKIKYLDIDGNSKILKSKNNLISIIIQHEMDHLDGILITDY